MNKEYEETIDPYVHIAALFARYYGWTLDYTLSLSEEQIVLMQQGLAKILSMEKIEADSSSNSNSSNSSNSNKELSQNMQKKNELFAQKLREFKQKGVKKVKLSKLLN